MENLINVQNIEGRMVVSSREVAKNFEKEHKNVTATIKELIRGCAENLADLFIETKYQNEQNKQWYPEYLCTRDGFTLLAMGFTGQKALEWKLKYIDAFNQMEKSLTHLEELSPELRLLINMELKQKEQDQRITQLNGKVESIKEVVALRPNDWRKGTSQIINRIAHSMGGNEHIQPIRAESYKLLDERMGVDLARRLTYKKRRMADEGVSKSRREKINQLDVIAEDRKLIEGYIAIIKEMAIKYGVDSSIEVA
ncbi:phage regulatory protein Rha family [Eubacterium limosum]|nr:phage regulatory protein Rha family [Eubacterium limosum]